jgi:acyl-CoA reductase-like NAD-dependent aldehyde dehydrogenase
MNYLPNGPFTKVYGHTLVISHWIAGAYEASGTPEQQLHNPAHAHDVRALLPEADASHIQAALNAATQAKPDWQQAPLSVRANIFERLCALLTSHGRAWARSISRETGLPRAHSRRQIQALITEIRHLRRSETDMITPGVCGLISSAHFPLAGPANLLLTALKAGQTVVWAPSPLGSVTACLLTHFLTLAGLPPGVLNVVYGATARQLLLEQAKQGHLQQLGFAGPQAEAEPLVQFSQDYHVPVRFWNYGASTLVILPDAPLDVAVPAALAATLNPVGATQIGVHRKIARAFQRRLLAAAEKWCVGDPSLHEKIDQGPLSSSHALEALVAAHGLGRVQAAEWLYGQGRISRAHKPKQFVGDPELGYYAWPLIGRAPTLDLADVPGPVALIHEVADEIEALTLAQKSPFAVMLYTENKTYIESFRTALQARWGGLNIPARDVAAAAYGGQGVHADGFSLSLPDASVQALLDALSCP